MQLFLEESIRDWVFFYILSFCFLIGLIKANVGLITRRKSQEKCTDQPSFRQNSNKALLSLADRYFNSSGLISMDSFKIRKTFFGGQSGFISKKADKIEQNQVTLSANQSMFKAFSVGNMLMGTFFTMGVLMYINNFFSGFLLAKLPFPLTQHYRGLVQRGVQLDSLDVGFLSGMSFYFISNLALGAYQSLFIEIDTQLDKAKAGEAPQPQPGMGMGMQQPAAAPNIKSDLASRGKQLQFAEQQFAFEKCSQFLLKKLKARK